MGSLLLLIQIVTVLMMHVVAEEVVGSFLLRIQTVKVLMMHAVLGGDASYFLLRIQMLKALVQCHVVPGGVVGSSLLWNQVLVIHAVLAGSFLLQR